MFYHCFFEQSGTFRDEFRKLGFDSFDYDISNDFGCTDVKVDLFKEIKSCYYYGESSLFDSFKSGDLIFAFFPCTYFECQNKLWFCGDSFSQKKWSLRDKLVYDIDRHEKLSDAYSVLNMLCVICLDRGFRLIIENPYTQPHYLSTYWCVKPAVIDLDRRENGDYYKKPTQYFFFGFEPYNNLVFEPLDYVPSQNIERQRNSDDLSRQVLRSAIHSQYAARFIKRFVIPVNL